ncbi:MAG: glycosyltransferase family 4 protein [Candidatus Hodarchaeales archaeon]|jgi:glycosyltransferase involved in cell wall biosynthesis
MDKKIKVLTLSDHPLSPSGVGTQTKYFITGLLETGKFQFYSLGGAIKHNNYSIVKTEEFKDDWIIQPVDGYGNQDMIRSILNDWKPDIVWFMTDPRFYGWLWEIENEIRVNVPMVYYHVWDNFPYPDFNKIWYDSTDHIATISKLTSNIVRNVSPNVGETYIPHAVPTDIFKAIDKSSVNKFRKEKLNLDEDNFFIFWTNRNARRKQSGSLLFWFKKFLDKLEQKYGHRNSTLLMHTEPNDPNGQDLYAIAEKLNLKPNKEILFSREKVPPQDLSMLYNAADACITVSDAEGFGLYTFESMACETPIIATLTGGLQEQVTDIDEVSHEEILKRNKENMGDLIETNRGIGLEPSSKAIIGSQQVPYIYEDRVSGEQTVNSLMKMYEYGDEKRRELGKNCRKYVLENYSFEIYKERWEKLLIEIHEKNGSWETRKNYQPWELIQL